MPRKTSDAFSSLLKCRNSWRMTRCSRGLPASKLWTSSMTMSGSQSIEFVNAARDGAAMRRELLDSTSFVHALDQGAHFRLFFFQPEALGYQDRTPNRPTNRP